MMIYAITGAVFFMYLLYSLVLAGKRADMRYRRIVEKGKDLEGQTLDDRNKVAIGH